MLNRFMDCRVKPGNDTGEAESNHNRIHSPQRCGVWIPGPALRAVPE